MKNHKIKLNKKNPIEILENEDVNIEHERPPC